SVRSVAGGGDRVAVATVDGDGHRLWFSADAGDSWRAVSVPVAVPSGGDVGLAVTLHGDQLVVLADPGTGARAWWGSMSAGG
ncbi:hypothetical protein C1I93_23405, partial [Micromonospora endophytica]